MPQIDMSAAAVTARLKLVSQLRRLCLLLGTAKIDPRPLATQEKEKKSEQKPQEESK
jgi:hypothetical protein